MQAGVLAIAVQNATVAVVAAKIAWQPSTTMIVAVMAVTVKVVTTAVLAADRGHKPSHRCQQKTSLPAKDIAVTATMAEAFRCFSQGLCLFCGMWHEC